MFQAKNASVFANIVPCYWCCCYDDDYCTINMSKQMVNWNVLFINSLSPLLACLLLRLMIRDHARTNQCFIIHYSLERCDEYIQFAFSAYTVCFGYSSFFFVVLHVLSSFSFVVSLQCLILHVDLCLPATQCINYLAISLSLLIRLFLIHVCVTTDLRQIICKLSWCDGLSHWLPYILLKP